MKYKTDEDFDKKYTQDDTIKSENFENGRFETFGNDIKTVLSFANDEKKKNRVFTAVDTDLGLAFVAGYHLVNRVYYIITKENFTDENECYYAEIDENGKFLVDD